MPRPVLPCASGLSLVQICMRVELNHAKNGFLSRFARSMKSSVALRNSSSAVSMRFLVSGPESSQLCLYRALAGDERGAAGGAGLLAVIVGEDRALGGDAVDVGRAVAHHA